MSGARRLLSEAAVGPAVAAAAALLYALLLLVQGHPYDVDRVTAFLPFAHAGGEAWSHGSPPLWVPGMWSGYPLFAEGQGGFLSPLQLGWIVAGDAVAFLDVHLVLTLVLAALSGALAARLLGLGSAPQAAAGIVWALGGGLVAYQENPAVLATSLAMPLVLAAATRSRWWLLTGALVFSILGGHPYFYALGFVLAALGCAGAVVVADPKERAATAGKGALALGAAVALGAVQWLPTLELVAHSDRVQGLSSAARAQALLTYGDLTYLIDPLYSRALRYSSGSGVLAYVGLPALVLAVRGISLKDRLWSYWVGALCLAIGGLAVLASGPLAGVVAEAPLLGLLRGPSKLLVPLGATLALLAASGVQAAKQAPVRWGLVLLIALDVGSYGLRKADPVPRDALRTVPRVAELAGRGARLRVLGTQAVWGGEIPGKAPAAFLRDAQPVDANCGLLAGVTHVDGYAPLPLARAKAYVQQADTELLRGGDAGKHRAAGVTHLVLHPQLPAPPGCRPLARGPRWALYALDDPLPWARAHAAGAALPVVVVEQSPTRIVIEADLPAKGRVVVADAHYPGWTAAVDGQSAPIELEGGVFKAVAVPAGRHRVTFAFRSTTFGIGAAISLVALFGWLGAALWLRWTPVGPAETLPA
jgi:hypothetical protein